MNWKSYVCLEMVLNCYKYGYRWWFTISFTAENFYSTWVRSFLCSNEEMHEVTDHHYTASTNVRGAETFRWKSQHSVPMQQDENVQTVNLEYEFL